jgi:hypothetical protein
MGCETNDFLFPMQAEIFYPIVEQGAYGNVAKTWNLDRVVVCEFSPAGTATKEEVKPNIDITQSSLLIGRVKHDLRFNTKGDPVSINNIVITNIKDKNCSELYLESSGPRVGKSTIFEVATHQAIAGPFGGIEYYKVILRRSENQEVDV